MDDPAGQPTTPAGGWRGSSQGSDVGGSSRARSCTAALRCLRRSSPTEPRAKPADLGHAAGSVGRVTARSAAFFDLDKTVIAKSSTLAFGRHFYQGGLINRRAVLRSSVAQFFYLSGGADHQQMERMRAHLQQMCAGWQVQQVRDIVAEALHDLIDPMVYDEAATLIEEHRAAGRDVVIVSSSGEEVVGPIGELLGVDRVVATRMVVADGCYTGEISFYAHGEHKASAIRALAAEQGYDLRSCYAYSDSITDLPMLEAVGHPCGVNPDRALRKAATSRGWPVLVFRRSVRLRTRFPSLSAPSRPVIAMGTAMGAGALAWYARRRWVGA